MVAWQAVVDAEPAFAADVLHRLTAHGHLVLGTIRADGSPRVSGTEVIVRDGDVWLAGMPASRKAADLRRDPRFALHSGSDDPVSWTGDAKIAGRAIEVLDPTIRAAFAETFPEAIGDFVLFRLDLTEVVHVGLNEARTVLVVRWWTPAGGLRQAERA